MGEVNMLIDDTQRQANGQGRPDLGAPACSQARPAAPPAFCPRLSAVLDALVVLEEEVERVRHLVIAARRTVEEGVS